MTHPPDVIPKYAPDAIIGALGGGGGAVEEDDSDSDSDSDDDSDEEEEAVQENVADAGGGLQANFGRWCWFCQLNSDSRGTTEVVTLRIVCIMVSRV